MKRKALTSLLVLAMLLTTSCGGTATPSDTTVSQDTSADTTAAPAEEVYPYDISDLQKYEFTILNCEDKLWDGTYHVIDYDDLTGENVSDALYERARKAESDLNIKLAYVKKAYFDIYGEMSKTVLADEDVYDAVYTPLKARDSMPLSGAYGLNLYDIDTLHLNDEWWNQSFIDAATLMGDKLYTSIDYVNLMGYAYSNVLYVNKDMLEDHKLDTPYDTIRSGKWTYDEMNKYITAVVNLNGDDSYEAKPEGNCTYGFAVQHEEGTMSMLNGSGEFFISLDKDGVPQLS
ncbi:MAG: hypothetical protein IJ493_12315, partial [Clostridia bacterium]|nr:hypothetical protein [Clostridia bacterium]